MNRKNLGVNFLRKWEFELKFDRDTKEWSFKKLMRLYHSAKERADKRRKDFSDMIAKTWKGRRGSHYAMNVYHDVTCFLTKQPK